MTVQCYKLKFNLIFVIQITKKKLLTNSILNESERKEKEGGDRESCCIIKSSNQWSLEGRNSKDLQASATSVVLGELYGPAYKGRVHGLRAAIENEKC